MAQIDVYFCYIVAGIFSNYVALINIITVKYDFMLFDLRCIAAEMLIPISRRLGPKTFQAATWLVP